MGRRVFLIGSLLATAAAGSWVGAAPPAIASRWRNSPVVVDGAAGEWAALQRLGKLPLSGAFFNDADSLYACFTVSDPGARLQIMRGGLVIWLDGKGGKKKQVGFRFPVPGVGGTPVGLRSGRAGGLPPDKPPEPAAQGQDRPAGLPPLPEDLQQSVEILGPKKDDRARLLVADTHGFQARLGRAEGQLVLELRVPLTGFEQRRLEPVLAPGAVVGIRIETARLEEMTGRSGFPGVPGGAGGFPPGGIGGGRGGIGGQGGIGGRGGIGGQGGIGGRGGIPGGGGRAGGRRGGVSAERPEASKPFGEWFKVKLATSGQ